MQQFHLLSFLQISNSRQCQKPSKHCWKTSINKVGKLRTPHLPYPSALLSGWLPGQANCGWPWTFAQRTTTTTTPNTEDTSLQSMAQLLGVGISCWLNVPHLGAKLMRKVPGDKPPQNEKLKHLAGPVGFANISRTPRTPPNNPPSSSTHEPSHLCWHVTFPWRFLIKSCQNALCAIWTFPLYTHKTGLSLSIKIKYTS